MSGNGKPSRSGVLIGRISLLSALVGVLLAGCGGDFDYKISGDRAINEVRGARAGGGGKTATHEDLMKLQEQYQAKVADQESGAKK
ncbi:MAG: hypothetical protein OXJ53_16075 [Gammaproteobacteria bacterium]|nr:hypothetical protein [Gammaproteobacteria bacterium]MDE2897485.1 hypothetical protein [Chloroflexota bacterium]